jgi:hypothetical protein
MNILGNIYLGKIPLANPSLFIMAVATAAKGTDSPPLFFNKFNRSWRRELAVAWPGHGVGGVMFHPRESGGRLR